MSPQRPEAGPDQGGCAAAAHHRRSRRGPDQI